MGCCSASEVKENINLEQQAQKDLNDQNKKINKKTSSIVIVGAGPAGIHFYSLLVKAGYNRDNIIILEKENRTCGKSWTVKWDSPLILSDGSNYTPVDELGTCYLHHEYHIIEDLFCEYDNDNTRLPIPSRGCFGTSINQNIVNKKEEKTVDFMDWAMHKAEKIAIAPEFHWMPDAVSGGLAFYEAVTRYCNIHREIFGNKNQSKLHGSHGFLNQPTQKNMNRINCTFLEFLQRNNVSALIPFMIYSQTGQGYGALDKIPAFYGLYWITPALLSRVVDIFRLMNDAPNVLVVKYGFQRLWEKMIEKHQMNIILNCEIKSVNRYLNDIKKKTKIKYCINNSDDDNKSDQQKQIREIECDYLFLACGVKKSLSFLTDATNEEKEIFNTISPHTLCATVYSADVNANKLNETAGEMWPNIVLKADGHLYAHRNSAQCLLGQKGFSKIVLDGKLKRERTVAYQFLTSPPDPINDPDKLLKIVQSDLTKWGEENIKIIKQKVWDYFPVFTQDAINKGYPWIIRNKLQGKYNNTYYIGSSVSFESVLNVCEYNIEIFNKYKF